MTVGERLRRYLPPFLRPGGAVTEAITEAIGTAMQELVDEARLLRARGAANRFTGLFTSYYAGDERQDDLARIGMSRMLSKRTNETWDEFEARLVAFAGLEVWDGSRTGYVVTGDVAQWGTITGIVREVERTGLEASLVATRTDPLAWKLLDTDGRGGLDESELLDDTEPPEGQRLTRVWDDEWLWGFWLYVTNPDVVDYLADEVRSIVRDTKPAWVRCYLGLPDAEAWEVID